MKVDAMPTPAALPAEMTIYTVAALHREWRAQLATLVELPKPASAPKPAAAAKPARGPRTAPATPARDDAAWAIDASGVAEIDAAGLQLLLALAQSLALRGRTLRLAQPSAQLVDACGAIGLEALVSTPEATGGAA